MRARAGGREGSGEGPPLSGINSRGRRGARRRATCGRAPGARAGGGGPGARGAAGSRQTRAPLIPEASPAGADSGPSPCPCSGLGPRAQGKQGRGVRPPRSAAWPAAPGAGRTPSLRPPRSLAHRASPGLGGGGGGGGRRGGEIPDPPPLRCYPAARGTLIRLPRGSPRNPAPGLGGGG